MIPSDSGVSGDAERALPARVLQRRAYVAPLFAYCAEHCLLPLALARRAAIRATAIAHTTPSSPVASAASAVVMNKLRLSRIKSGAAATPDWFIAGMCREIGQPVEVVMGAEWAQQHLPALTPDVAPLTPSVSPSVSPVPTPKQRAS